MRTRSFALVTSLAAVTAALLPLSSASATDSSTIVRSLPAAGIGASAIKPVNFNCAAGGAGSGSTTTVTGPGTAPAGQGSLRLAVGSNDATEVGLAKNYPTAIAPSALTALSFNVYGVSGSAPLYVELYLDRDGTGAAVDNLELVVPANAGWQAVDGIAATYDLYRQENTTGNPDGTSTLAGYAQTNPSATLFSWYVTNVCNSLANQSLYVDTLRVGDNGADNATYDFEPASTLTVTGNSSTPLVAGSTRYLTATLKSGSRAITSTTVQVWAKTYPATTFSKVATLTTDSTGKVVYAAKPVKQTVYQFRYPGAEPTNGAANSALQTVTVATRISKSIADTTVSTTQYVVATGWTYPAKPGTAIYLYRGTTRIATGTVASNGSYRLQAKIATKGKFAITVRGAAGTGNVTGLSPATTVTVS